MSRTKTFLPTVLAGVLLFTAVSCDKDDDDPPPSNKYNVIGNASGAQEVPAVTSPNTITIAATYDANANTLGYTVTWTRLNDVVNNMHFHGPAEATISAPMAIGITGWAAA